MSGEHDKQKQNEKKNSTKLAGKQNMQFVPNGNMGLNFTGANVVFGKQRQSSNSSGRPPANESADDGNDNDNDNNDNENANQQRGTNATGNHDNDNNNDNIDIEEEADSRLEGESISGIGEKLVGSLETVNESHEMVDSIDNGNGNDNNNNNNNHDYMNSANHDNIDLILMGYQLQDESQRDKHLRPRYIQENQKFIQMASLFYEEQQLIQKQNDSKSKRKHTHAGRGSRMTPTVNGGIYNYGGGSNSSNGHMVNSMNQESSIETNTRLPFERMDKMNGVSTPPSHRSGHTMNDFNGIYGQHASNGLPNDVNYNYDCNNNNGGRPRKPPSKSSLHSHSQSHHDRMTNSSGSGGGGGGASKHYRHENDGYRFYRGDGDGNRNGNRNVGGVGRQVNLRRRARIQSDTRYNGSKKKRGSKRERRRFEHDLESEGNREFEFQNDRDKSQIVRRRQQHSSKNNCDLSNKYGKLNEMIQGGNENGYQGNQQRSNRSLSRSSTNLTTTTSILTRKTRNGQTNSDYYKKKRTRNLTGVVDESRRDNDAINSSNMNNGYGLNEYIGDTSRFKRKHKENLNLKHSNNRNKSKHDFIAEKEKQKEKQKIKQKSRQMGNISVKRKKNVYDNYQSNSVDVPRDSDDDHDDDDNNNNESDRSDRSDKSDEYDEYDENEQDDDVLGDDMDTESVPSSAHNNNNNNNSNNSHNKRRIQMEGEHRSGNSRKVDDVDPYDHENNFGGYVLLNNKNLQLNDMNEMELFDDNKNSRDLDTSFDMESNIYDNGNMNNSNVTDHENYNYEILAAKKNISQMNKQMKNLSNMTGKDAKYLIKKNQFNDE